MHLHIQSTHISSGSSFIQSLSWSPQSGTNEGIGWIAINNALGVTGVTRTSLHDNIPKSYNLYSEHHKSQIAHIQWNDVKKILTTCDEHGNICQWISGKTNLVVGARFKLNYPQSSNESRHTVIDIAWSHNGKILVVCFSNGFLSILDEEHEERRSYTFVNPISNCVFSCLAFDPDDSHILLGTVDGYLIVVSVLGNEPVIQDTMRITITDIVDSIVWSCPRFRTEETYYLWQKKCFSMVICLNNGAFLIQESYDDLIGVRVQTGLCNIIIQWSTSGELLAVAGQRKQFKINNSNNTFFNLFDSYIYSNVVSIYNKRGSKLVYAVLKEGSGPFESTRITGIHWAHRDKCIFVACGCEIFTARVTHDSANSKVATLQQICCSKVCALMEQNKYPTSIMLPPAIQTQLKFMLKPVINYPFYVRKHIQQENILFHPPKEYIHCTLKNQNNSVYTLYMEFLGTLVPLLSAIRSPKRNVEFIILDPKTSDINADYSTIIRKLSHTFQGQSKTKQFLRKCRRNTKVQDLIDTKLSETHEAESMNTLAVVISNTWKTKFKIKLNSSTIPMLIGKINYNPSVLHMMPRKINVEMICSVKDEGNTNYFKFNNELVNVNMDVLTIQKSNNGGMRVNYSSSLPLLTFCFDCKEKVELPKNYTTESIISTNYCNDIFFNQIHNWSWLFQSNAVNKMKFYLNSENVECERVGINKTSFFKNLNVILINISNTETKYTFIEEIYDEWDMYKILIPSKSSDKISIPREYSKLWDISRNKTLRNQDKNKRLSQHLILNTYEVNEELIQNTSTKLQNLNLNRTFKHSSNILEAENKQKPSHATYKLQNKTPTWNKSLCIYQLDCGGRVTVESEKNCQFEYNGKRTLQFGRIGTFQFTLDFCYPFTPLQAFAIALSSLTHGMK